MFLSDNLHVERGVTFLCLRRGVSDELRRHAGYDDFSLPTQRCFSRMFLSITLARLFSAYAEVFPLSMIRPPQARSFLCLRRGVSGTESTLSDFCDFSLPTQRCFYPHLFFYLSNSLFSAYAEVFPVQGDHERARVSFLCLRRGVSRQHFFCPTIGFFSLPTQRCFRLGDWES